MRFFLPVILLLMALLTAGATPAQKPPFVLPFAMPAGPSTWLVGQMYGNTTSAYFQRASLYRLGQGIHFGIDLNAPCGTPIVAIGDGVVVAVDGPYGSAPHNLLIDHPNGYSSLYGHLLEAPKLKPGQKVKAGEQVALSGDMYGTCRSAPHLHLEVRDLTHLRAYNPVPLIDADWDALLLYGGGGSSFERDLDAPDVWQSIYDQPDIQFGGRLLNDYDNPWPTDTRR